MNAVNKFIQKLLGVFDYLDIPSLKVSEKEREVLELLERHRNSFEIFCDRDDELMLDVRFPLMVLTKKIGKRHLCIELERIGDLNSRQANINLKVGLGRFEKGEYEYGEFQEGSEKSSSFKVERGIFKTHWSKNNKDFNGFLKEFFLLMAIKKNRQIKKDECA